MPRVRRRTLKRKGQWSTRHVELALYRGWSESVSLTGDRQATRELVQQCWEEIGKDLMRDWIGVHPGSRPAAWWLTEGKALGLELEHGIPNWPAGEPHTHWDGQVECRRVHEDSAYELVVLSEAGVLTEEEYERLYEILEERGPTRCMTWWQYYGSDLPGAPVLVSVGDPPLVRSMLDGETVLEPQWVVLERADDLDAQETELLEEFRAQGVEPWSRSQPYPDHACGGVR